MLGVNGSQREKVSRTNTFKYFTMDNTAIYYAASGGAEAWRRDERRETGTQSTLVYYSNSSGRFNFNLDSALIVALLYAVQVYCI